MAVWVHFVLLPLLYLVDGKPKLPGGASRKNSTKMAENNMNKTDILYHFDYQLFKNKSSFLKPSRLPKRLVRESMVLDQIEVRFDWNRTIPEDRHVGALFLLRRQEQVVENALLYPPNDVRLTVRNLKEGVAYRGQVRVIKDPQQLEQFNSTNDEDRFKFVFESPSVVSESDVKGILKAIKELPETKIKLEAISINFKLPTLQAANILEIKDMGEENDMNKISVHIVPRTISLIINDLPSATVLRVSLLTNGTAAHTTFVFTGSISGDSQQLQPITKNLPDKNRERLTVKCFVKDKPPFQGFPCKGSNICIPLHWECDGEEDCVGGFDESRCNNNKRPEGSTHNPPPHKCKKNEFPCVSKTVPVCLPTSWLCDGRTDCSDGWDENKDNCQEPEHINITGFSYCDRNHFKCHRGGCVTKRKVCDGYKDCSDGSDEFDCVDDDEDEYDDDDDDDDFFCDPNYEFSCDKRSSKAKCIPRPWVCDDQDDCPFGEDETDYICKSHYHNFFDKKRQS